MKKILAPLMLTVATLLIVVVPVAAGEREGAVSLAPFVGGYTFDGVQHLETAPVYGLRLGYDLTKNWGVEAVGDYLATDGTHSERSVNALSYRLDLLYNFMPDGPLVPYLAVGGGGTTVGHGSDFDASGNNVLGYTGGRNTAATANAGLGLKYFLTDSIALRGDARQLAIFGQKTLYNWEYTAGLSFLFGGKTAAAPVPPAPVPTSSLSVTPGSITKGESARLSWTSQNAANCDLQPGIGPVTLQGSMTIMPGADTTYSLSCNGPGGMANSAANITVAAPPSLSSSLTVTPGSITKGESASLNWTSQNAANCDIQPGIGPVTPQGSITITPAANTAYTLTCTGSGGTTTSQGNIQVAPKQEKVCIVLKIEFDSGKADIKPKYHDEIGKVAAFMKKYPEAKGVIEGHTDNVGGYDYNMKLSERRAVSVRNYLLEKYGVAPERLSAKGYGYSKPVADNKTKEGRQLNRRIVANFDCILITK